MTWSWVLAALGVTGLYLVTRKNWRGYAIGVGVQLLWIAYAVVTRQWGFIFSALAYGSVNLIGLRGWRKAERETLTPEEAQAARQLNARTVAPYRQCSESEPHPPHRYYIGRIAYECRNDWS